MPNVIQKLVFDGVGFASKFLSSLVPWPLAMVPHSRRKILSSLLVKIPTFVPPSVYLNLYIFIILIYVKFL